MNSAYKDKRQEFFKSYFNKALHFKDYLSSGNPSHGRQWQEYYEKLSLNHDQTQRLESYKRKMNVLFMSGIWCGDCCRQGPMLQTIADNCSLIDLRFIDNRSNPELKEELRINGAEKVPVAVVLSEDFFELARFGDRHLSSYREQTASLMQVKGASCDIGLFHPELNALKAELNEWFEFIERLQLMLRVSPALRRRYND